MANVSEITQRLFLHAVCAALGACAVIVYLKYGFGLGAGILGGLCLLAGWGTITKSPRIREALTSLFSSVP